jgi:ParB-like chromosome segregation protein Spo0J
VCLGPEADGGAEVLFDRRRSEKVAIDALLPADSPRVDGEDGEHVRVLVELGGDLPPIVVQRSTMRVVDGMHRLRAAALRGDETIEVCYFDGVDEDAFVLAVKINSSHGLPLSAADRTAAVERILASHPHWSDQVIASATGVSDKTVAGVRRRSTSEASRLNYRVGRDGRRRPLNPEQGRLRASELIAQRPDAPLREIAAGAGVALATARDVRERLRRGHDPVPQRQHRTEQPRRGRPSPDSTDNDAGVRAALSSVSPGFQVLARDPALRANEEGRILLRLLSLNMLSHEKWEQIIDSIPSHCASTAAEMARTCSMVWTRVAHSLDVRDARVDDVVEHEDHASAG